MKTEFELRFYPIDEKSLKKKFEDLELSVYGGSLKKFRRVVYDIDAEKRKFLRIRQCSNNTSITLKEIINAGSIDGAQELEINIGNKKNSFYDLSLLFKYLGFDKCSYQENKRREYRIIAFWDTSTNTFYRIIITVDLWPGIKPLLEIESESKEAVLWAQEQLGLKDPFPGDIPDIYTHVYGISREEFNAIPELTFDNYEKILKR